MRGAKISRFLPIFNCENLAGVTNDEVKGKSNVCDHLLEAIEIAKLQLPEGDVALMVSHGEPDARDAQRDRRDPEGAVEQPQGPELLG